MKTAAIILSLTLISGVAATPAIAEGYYGAVDLGQSKAKDGCTGLPAGVVGCKDQGSMYRIAGGYQFATTWGAEVGYGNYGKESAGTLGAASADWELSGIQISGTGTFPLTDAFSLIGKLGVASTKLKITGKGGMPSPSATSTKLAYGIGAQYDVTKNFSIRGQYEDLGTVGDSNTGTSKVTLLSAGVVFKF